MLEVFKNQPEATITRGALPCSTELVTVCDNKASVLIKLLTETENGNELIVKAFESGDAMLALFKDFDIEPADVIVEGLADCDDDTAHRLLKSQQSKQSRSKNSALTAQNFKKMASASLAVAAIREACNIEGQSTGNAGNPMKPITEENLQWYAEHQDVLAKAIRNIQSKKSIYKKANTTDEGFDDTTEEWLKLLDYESKLISVRASKSPSDRQKPAKMLLNVRGILSEHSVESLEKLKKAELVTLILEIQKAANELEEEAAPEIDEVETTEDEASLEIATDSNDEEAAPSELND